MTDAVIKPKRKYTRKTKIVQTVSNTEIENTELVPDTEPVPIFLRGYTKVDLYIYYQGNDIDTLKYIKRLQLCLDNNYLGSQVVIATAKRYESVGINNCFRTETIPSKWTDLSLTFPVKCVKIIERARCSMEDLFKTIETNTNYSDPFMVIEMLE